MKNIFTFILILFSFGCVESNQASSENTIPQETKEVFENWFQSQQTSEVAKNVLKTNFYVVLDGSGSMDESTCADGSTKQVVARKALQEFSKTLPSEYNLGLLAFDSDGITERLPLGTSNRDAFIQAVNSVKADSGTPLETAITKGYEKLALQAKKQQGYGEYHLVVVTDGEPSMGEDPAKIVKTIATGTPVIMHTLGFCISANHVLNSNFVDFKPANNPKELVKGLKEVITESLSFKTN
ncbi:VWA domain-containing protein [bacterium]|nr:VWA domain-containing protein [bacterium]